MYLVKLYPSTLSTYHYVAQIYAGLYDLEALGQIKLEFTHQLSKKISRLNHHLLWLEVEDLESKKKCHICFDMHDGGAIKSREDLAQCDVYFKRSYNQQLFFDLSESLKEKIRPYGFCYDCISPNEKMMVKEPFLHYLIHGNNLSQATIKTIGYSFLRLASKYNPDFKFLGRKLPYQMLTTDFEVHPEELTEKKILFQTRIWDPNVELSSKHIGEARIERIKQIKEFNNMRVATLQALKKRFKERFVGGLRFSEFAQMNYPDLLTRNKTSKKDYIHLVKRCLIAVTTSGRVHSTGLKFAEYVAASRCIVSEPLYYSLPDQPLPFKEGANYLSFRSPEDCVEACEKILDNPQFANQMRRNNYDYYNKSLKPSALISNCLKTAIESV